MFNFLTLKEKGILCVFPVLMIGVIIFQFMQVNYWRNEAAFETERKQLWQQKYFSLNDQMEKFTEKQTALLNAVNQLTAQNQQQKQEITHALQKHQDWSDQRVPDDVKRLLNQHNAH